MTSYGSVIEFKTKGEVDIIDITDKVSKIVKKSKINNGIVCVFNKGSTGAITTIEYEPGLLQDLPDALERLFPKNIEYKHHLQWHDGNGHSHVRASVLGPSVTIPLINGEMPLGTWQQIVMVDLDVRARSRQVLVQVVGD
jgi:secondary thiamine-phosphate synthase enzyme